MTHEPVVVVQLQRGKLLGLELADVPAPRLGFAVGDLVNAPGVLARVARVMAFAGVRKIADIHAAIRTVRQTHAHEPRIGRAHDIRRVRGGVPAALAREHIHVHAPTMNVVHEHLPAIFRRPIIAEIHHRAAVRVPTAGLILLGSADARADGLGVREMQMIGNGRNALIGKPASGPITTRLIVCTLDHVKEMRVHAVADKRLAVIIPVNAPRIGRAISKNLPAMLHRMIPPYATINTPALSLWGARFAHQ